MKTLVHPGDRYGAWTVIREVEKRGDRRMILCRCSCGAEKPVLLQALRNGDSRRCRACSIRYQLRHGHCRARRDTPEHAAWRSMLQRCSNPHNASYHKYGAKGISVCERWKSFENFLADMGLKPSAEYSLDRIDSAGHYSPENCRWATTKQQNNNKRTNLILQFDGRSLTLAQWAAEIGMNPITLHARISNGWSVEKALTAPIRPRST